MRPKKRPQLVEYTPSTPSLPTTETITSHHTHYEPRHRPVKSTVTVEGHVVEDMPSVTLMSPLTSLASLVASLDDDGIEQVECEGQELEAHGLPNHHDTEAGFSVDGARKRRRTQAVWSRFIHQTNSNLFFFGRITPCSVGLNASTIIWLNFYTWRAMAMLVIR